MRIFIIIIHVLYLISKFSTLEKKCNNYINLYNKFNFKNKIYNENIHNINKILFKYTNYYTTRSYIDFKNNRIVIETLNKENTNNILKEEIINIFSYNHIYDYYIKDNKNINNINFINNSSIYSIFYNKFKKNIKYISYLLLNIKCKKIIVNKDIIVFSIYIDIIPNDKIIHKFDNLDLIKNICNEYNIDYILVLSIIHVESNFNPYIVSKLGAIGLMQIIQNKSGVDVFKMLNKKGFPNINYLLNAETNIKTGSMYIYILQNNYLLNIKNKMSLKYITIASYNGGVDNILKIFSNNYENSINFINSKNEKDVYKYIINHSSNEIRNYLQKVNNTYIYYKNKKI